MLYAMCLNPLCDFSTKLHDTEEGRSIDTPKACPLCKSEVFSACPNCDFPLVGAPGSPRCQVFGVSVKAPLSRNRA
jgi:hypothetical protein